MISWLKKVLGIPPAPEWVYGTAGQDRRIARKNASKGNVQFLLWQPGEQGHSDGCWHDFDCSWWPTFEPEKETANGL